MTATDLRKFCEQWVLPSDCFDPLFNAHIFCCMGLKRNGRKTYRRFHYQFPFVHISQQLSDIFVLYFVWHHNQEIKFNILVNVYHYSAVPLALVIYNIASSIPYSEYYRIHFDMITGNVCNKILLFSLLRWCQHLWVATWSGPMSSGYPKVLLQLWNRRMWGIHLWWMWWQWQQLWDPWGVSSCLWR